MPAIVFEGGPRTGQIIKLPPEGFLLFGRGQDCHVQFEDPLASRHHFCIESGPSGNNLIDQKSNNGTYLNGVRIDSEDLEIGDEIQVGSTLLKYTNMEEAMEEAGMFGQSIGGYKIEHRLGRGGMGTVYLARQLSIGRRVALKVMSSSRLSNPAAHERFAREAQAVGQLTHPNVVQAYDFGEEDGVVYFSMEYMPGGSLGDLLHYTDQIHPVGALSMMIEVASGLAFAETQNIVHRDIKPENLLIDAHNVTKIGDLGIAVNIQRESEEARRGIGTPHYMAPEQVLEEEVSHKTDIYALGGTLYRMLSGRYPFLAETSEEIMQAQVDRSAVPLVSFVEDVSPDLSYFVDRMMSKSPSDRPTAEQLILEFERCLALEKTRQLAPAKTIGFERSVGPQTIEIDESDDDIPAGFRVLAVDDEETIRNLVSAYLEALGCQPFTAASGPEALQTLQTQTFDLIITDRMMPGMWGDEFAFRVRERHPGIPILMLTALGGQMKAAGEHPQGIDLILSKPISLKKLKRAVSLMVPE